MSEELRGKNLQREKKKRKYTVTATLSYTQSCRKHKHTGTRKRLGNMHTANGHQAMQERSVTASLWCKRALPFSAVHKCYMSHSHPWQWPVCLCIVSSAFLVNRREESSTLVRHSYLVFHACSPCPTLLARLPDSLAKQDRMCWNSVSLSSSFLVGGSIWRSQHAF